MQEIHYTIRQLQHFVAVAETGAISRAVERCHTSQPGISLSISELERGLGMKLLVRQRAKGVSLTPAGSDFLVHARELLEAASDLQSRVDSEKGSLSGRLAIGCYPPLEPAILTPLLAGFLGEAPGVTLEIQEAAQQPEIEEGLREGRTELALLYGGHLGDDLATIVMDVLKPYVLLPEDHRFADDDDVSLVDMADEPMILFDNSPSLQNWQRSISSLDIEPRIGMRSGNFEFIRCLVGRGVGYAFLIQRPASDLTFEGKRVVVKAIREPMPTTPVVLAYAKDARLSPRAISFIEFAVKDRRARRRLPGDAADHAEGQLAGAGQAAGDGRN
ncbi:LysR substrate-binding domain-containing protein [Microbacterium sp.]|uniref:LysR substrate-binding domain-containing protein n=1 Tax=Microbacterium sp. TaxID=51671 RepID=UPI001AC875BF|nr:LysR substrate-binding domain-containing protein [Microbacterium sp.]MBN9189186.1 LysR family transcriptional regulator [Microbacterium sp.]MBN9193766.1 LysR family transcriptional regulator [Microbacterium sp.]